MFGQLDGDEVQRLYVRADFDGDDWEWRDITDLSRDAQDEVSDKSSPL